MEFGTDPHKLVRRDGMDTSRDAANEVCTTKLEAEVYMVIKAAGRAGMISDEVRKAMPHVTSYSSVTARYKSFIRRALVCDSRPPSPLDFSRYCLSVCHLSPRSTPSP